MEGASLSSQFRSDGDRIKPARLVLLLAFSTYLFFSLVHLSLPGLQYDEVLFTNAALGDVDGTFIEWKIQVFNKTIPLMLMRYIGALKALIYAPIFRFIGMSAATVRLPTVLLGLVSLTLTYVLVRRMLGAKTALATLVFLAADPSFIFSGKLDWGPVALMLALKASSLYLMWRWLEEGKRGCLLAGSFLLGLGVYDKIVFAWTVIGVLIALRCCFWSKFKTRIGWREIVLSMVAFAIGCSPLIAFNLTHGMQTFHGHGITIGRWGESLIYRYNLFYSTFDGGAVYDVVNRMDLGDYAALPQKGSVKGLDAILSFLAGLPLRGTLMPQFFVLALIGLLLLWLCGRLASARVMLFFLIQFATTAFFIYLSDDATGPHHTIMVYPVPHIVIASCLVELLRLGEAPGWLRRGALRFSSCLCIIALVASQVIIDARYAWSFQAKGGTGSWSDAIYGLAAYARSQPDKTFLLMDWGFSTQLLLLSGARIRKEEIFASIEDASGDEKQNRMQPYLRMPNAVMVFHAPPFETFPLLESFQKAAQQKGMIVNPVKTFFHRDGTPVYRLIEISYPGLNSYLQKGTISYFREAEDWDERAGGNLDLKQGASRGKALGVYWGKQQTDFALYRFSLPRQISDAHIYFRYAFEGSSFQQYRLYLDGNLTATFDLAYTGGFGYAASEWRLYGLRCGTLAPGTHELKIAPAGSDQVVNLDYFCICEGEFLLDFPPPAR